MDLCYDVTNQKVTRNAKKFIVNRSQNYLRLVFDFKTADWEDTIKYCIFHHNGKHYRKLLDDDEVTVPSVVLQDRSFRFTLYGVNGEGEDDIKITGEEITVHLRESGYVPRYDNEEEIGNDLLNRILLLLGEAIEYINE